MSCNLFQTSGSGGGSRYWGDAVATASALPPSGAEIGEIRLVIDTDTLYEWNGSSWVVYFNPASQFVDPLTTNGDMIARISGNTTRLPIGSTGQVLTVSGGLPSWQTPAPPGTGDVVGPSSATDNAIARYDLTTGKLIQNSVVTVGDSGAMSGITQLNVDNIQIDGNFISSTDTNGDIILDANGTGNTVSTKPLVLPEVSTPSTPGSGFGKIYFKSDGVAYALNDSGTETPLISSMPTGVVSAFAGSSAPAGFLICDGAAVSRATYSGLFAIIGITHGQGNGTTTFNVPDYRGRFLRGVTGASSNDPDSASRTAMNTGGNTGNSVGSVQGHAFQTHLHAQQGAGSGSGQYPIRSGVTSVSAAGDTASASASGSTSQASANETRPINAYVTYIIKT